MLLKALAKERHDRYKDVYTMVEAFQHALLESTQPNSDEMVPQNSGVEATIASAPSPTVPAASRSDKASIPEAGLENPAPVTVAVDAGLSPDIQPEKHVLQAYVKTTRRGSPWMWLAVCIILIVASLVTFFALRGLETVAKVPHTSLLNITALWELPG